MYERNLSPHTLRNYRIDLGQFYDYLAPEDGDGRPRPTQLDDTTHEASDFGPAPRSCRDPA